MPDPNDRAGLARRYRRLLLAYPRLHRRRHATEMVTTLLDAAPPDRTRPTRPEVVDLLLGGLRCRLRVRGAAAIVAAVTAALFGAVALGSFGGFVGWQTVRPLPADAEAARLVEPALQVKAGTVTVTRWDFTFDDEPAYTDPRWAYWLAGTDAYRRGQVWFEIAYAGEPPKAQIAGDATEAVRRLRAAGWQPAGSMGYDFLAVRRDGWRIEIGPGYRLGASDRRLSVALTREPPAAVTPLTLAGLPLGALAGWWLVAWAGRRRPGPAAQILLVLGLSALTPATVVSAVAIGVTLTHPDEPVAGWVGYTFVFFRAFAWLGALCCVAAASTAVRGGDARWPAVPATR